MLDDAERLDRCAADALRRRVGGDQLRVLRFEIAQLSHELVELGVADLGLVEHEVAVLVVRDLRAQLFDALFRRLVRPCLSLSGHEIECINALFDWMYGKGASERRPSEATTTCEGVHPWRLRHGRRRGGRWRWRDDDAVEDVEGDRCELAVCGTHDVAVDDAHLAVRVDAQLHFVEAAVM